MDYLEYKGQKFPYRVSYSAFKSFEKEFGKPYGEMDESNPNEVESLFFYSLQAGFAAENKSFTIKKEDIELILDEVYPQLITQGSEKLQKLTNQKKSLLSRILPKFG